MVTPVCNESVLLLDWPWRNNRLIVIRHSNNAVSWRLVVIREGDRGGYDGEDVDWVSAVHFNPDTN